MASGRNGKSKSAEGKGRGRRAAGLEPAKNPREGLVDPREYPLRPVVGVGGVILSDSRALLIRRGHPPLEGQWSIPGGTLEVGETLEEGAKRELAEETGLAVRIVRLIELFERIFRDAQGRVQYHFVILDYLCEPISGQARAGGDVTDVAWAAEGELPEFHLTPTATRVLRKAFRMARKRNPAGGS